MESATTTRASKPQGSRASTLAEAFQLTAAANPDRPAIRTKDDEFTCTWGEYAEKVESVARGLAALGLGAGDTIGLMLTNRPEFHFVDSAALHLGRHAVLDLQHLHGRADRVPGRATPRNKILVTEKAFLDPSVEQVTGARDRGRGRRRRRRTARSTLADVEAKGDAELRLRGRPGRP